MRGVDLRAGSNVLDVAAGNGNATLAAARRFAHVTSTDYVGALLERGRERAAAERLPVTFREADAEALPFGDGTFDVALSTFGVMFTPDQAKAAAELIRVVGWGGRIGLANWTPDGFIGLLLKIVAKYLPPPVGIMAPTLWGTEKRLRELFPGHDIRISPQTFTFRYESAEHWLDVFREYYGPTNRAFASLDAEKQSELEADILDLLDLCNWDGTGRLVIPGEYLEVVITKSQR
jgi:ubiquinone/menaquinone biosynthesis C-methylase UbiE